MAQNDDAERGERAARILEAADELLGEVGFDAASIARVARRADVNKALVFYYFGSKESLFQQVLERYYQAHQRALASAFADDGPLRDRLHRMMDAYFDFIVANDRYPRLVQQLVASGDRHLELVQRNLAPLFQWITEALSEIAPADGPLAARQFFVTFSGTVINYFTYSPVLAAMWGDDPTSEQALAERRDHLHWLVDTILDRLESQPSVGRKTM
jgi:AcrR family transcriptional regulator